MKRIDMSVFVGQDFDCEFAVEFPAHYCHIGKLMRINKGSSRVYGAFDTVKGRRYFPCRPRLNHWHFNDGSMVLPDGLVVECIDYEGVGGSIIRNSDDIKQSLEWKEEEVFLYEGDSEYYLSPVTIVAVKILGLQEGYEHEGMEVRE